jgi:hypothetical protein
LTALDPVFERAQSKNEFEFILSLLAVRGLQDAGWSPYETSLEAIDSMVALHNETSDFKTGRHLKLWIYGHIVEASEPYELVANLFAIIVGGRYRIGNFPAKRGRPPSPGQKLEQLEAAAVSVEMPDAIVPLKEVWDRELRNAIFHADYALHGGEVRLPAASQRRTHAELERLMARANAHHDALAQLRKAHIASYREPKLVSAYGFSPDPNEKGVVLVREGGGLVGVKDAWTAEDLARGAIPWRMALLRPGDAEVLATDPSVSVLPNSRRRDAQR